MTSPALKVTARDIKWGESLSVEFSRAERAIMRRRRRIPVGEWARKHRVMTMGRFRGSRWQGDVTPYLDGIMDASFHPSVEEVYLCATPQTGKSESILNCLGYAIDRAPGPILATYPDELTAKENSQDRVLPMIKQSPRLASYLTGRDDDEAIYRINLAHVPLYFAWASSAARLANKPIRYAVGDEVDKYPETAGKKEAGPLDLLRARMATYRWGRKLWMISTPSIEEGPIWVALTREAEIVFDYWVVCPDCGKWLLMHFEKLPKGGLAWPDNERDANRVETLDLARYECDQCGALWDDYMRDRAVHAGRWFSREGEGQQSVPLSESIRERQPRKIGFHLPSWLSPFVGLSEIAGAFLRSLGDKNKLKDFNNRYKAEPWLHIEQARREDRILALRDDRPRMAVPGGGVVACLTAGVDTQDDGVWYEIRAWGWGLERESWQIREGFIPKMNPGRDDDLDLLAVYLFESEYQDVDGKKHRVRFAVQDAMGHRASSVIDFARRHRGLIVPSRGAPGKPRQHIAQTNWEFYPGTKKPIPGGLKLITVDTHFFKNRLDSKLDVNPADPGAWRYHSETTEDWARQMCSEALDEKDQWVQIGSRPNHGWDCSVLNLVAAEILGVAAWEKPSEGQPASPKPPARGQGQPWIRRSGGWIRR